MAKVQKYTFTLDSAVVAEARRHSSNLSSTITNLLRYFNLGRNRHKFREELKNYEKLAKERRVRHKIIENLEKPFV